MGKRKQEKCIYVVRKVGREMSKLQAKKKIINYFKKNSIEELSYQQAEFIINTKEKSLEKEKSTKGDK